MTSVVSLTRGEQTLLPVADVDPQSVTGPVLFESPDTIFHKIALAEAGDEDAAQWLVDNQSREDAVYRSGYGAESIARSAEFYGWELDFDPEEAAEVRADMLELQDLLGLMESMDAVPFEVAATWADDADDDELGFDLYDDDEDEYDDEVSSSGC
jgi:hypothetical protein